MRALMVALALVSAANASSAAERGLRYGPIVALSKPTHDAAGTLTQRVAYGVTGTFVEDSRRGFGLDIAYHRWPASPGVGRSLDELLSLFAGEPISGSRTTVSMVQATLFGKILAPSWKGVLPWIKLGAGVYRYNVKLELPIAALQDAGMQVLKSDPDDVTQQFGYQLGAGIDFEVVPGRWVSLDVSSQTLVTREPYFTVFTIGASLLRRP